MEEEDPGMKMCYLSQVSKGLSRLWTCENFHERTGTDWRTETHDVGTGSVQNFPPLTFLSSKYFLQENFVMVHMIAERLIVPEEFGSVLIAADVSVQNKTSSGTLFRRQKDYFMF